MYVHAGRNWGKGIVHSATQPNNDVKCRNESNDIIESRTPTFAFAFSYVSTSGQNQGPTPGSQQAVGI